MPRAAAPGTHDPFTEKRRQRVKGTFPPIGPTREGLTELDKVVVHVDGGARGNPGPAAVAAVAAAPDGGELAERSAYIGEATNNVAEYRAVLLGLELARELGATRSRSSTTPSWCRSRSAASTRSSTRA